MQLNELNIISEFYRPIAKAKAVTKEQVGKKVAELLKRKDLPMGYVELFGKTQEPGN